MAMISGPSNFDPNNIPVADEGEDIDALVQQWFEDQSGQDPDSGDQGTEGEGGAGAAVTAPVPPPPVSATSLDADAPPPPADPFGEMPLEARTAYAQFLTWASQDPSRLEALDKFWRGEAQLIAGDQAAAPPSAPVAPQGAPPSPQVQQPVVPTTQLPAPIKELQDGLEAVKTVTRAVYTDYQQRQAAEVQSTYTSVVNTFKTEYALNDDQFKKLEQAAAATGLAKPLTDQHGIAMGIRKLLDATMAMEPEFRQHLLQRDAAKNKGQQEKARKQAALVGSPGSVTRSPANPPQTGRTRLSNPERVSAIASHIAQAQGATE